jgi:hypothetical protein
VGKVSDKLFSKDAQRRRAARRDDHSAASSQAPHARQDRLAAIVMSLLAALVFGGFGLAAIFRHAVTWPGRSGLIHSTGATADRFGWLLLGIASVFLIHLAMVLKPGRAGVKWIAGISAAWILAAVAYFVLNRI